MANAGLKKPFKITWLFGEDNKDRELFSPRQQGMFYEAAQRWHYVILGWPAPAQGKGIDNLKINVELRDIDGSQNITARVDPDRLRTLLSSAGPLAYLPYEATMEFDEWDLQALDDGGMLLDTITHEIGHALGFGTVWKDKGLLKTKNRMPLFTGKNARTEYGRLLGKSAEDVPVEDEGDDQTRNVHWKQTVFASEMMTGSGTSKMLSRMTVASMADLGYIVEPDAAEPYTLPEPAPERKQAEKTKAY